MSTKLSTSSWSLNSRSPCLYEIVLPPFAFFLARPKQASILSMRVPFSWGMIQKRQQLFFIITLLSHFSMHYSTVHTQDYSADSLNYIIVHYWMCLLLLTHNSGCLNKQCMVIMPLSPLNSSKTASS